MRTERPHLNGKVHRDGGCMPSGRREPFENGVFGGDLVEMERLRIEFGCEPLDILCGDRHFAALEAHAKFQIIEPLDHCAPVTSRRTSDDHPRFNSLKKSLPLSSMIMKAGKPPPSMPQIPSMPISEYPPPSPFLMQCSASFAPPPPIEPR